MSDARAETDGAADGVTSSGAADAGVEHNRMERPPHLSEQREAAGDAPNAPSKDALQLANIIAAARQGNAEAIDRLFQTALAGGVSMAPAPAEASGGVEHLLFLCAGVGYAAPLALLREALPGAPASVPLPASPPWLLGIFPLRSEILGLVDPAPLLTGRSTLSPAAISWPGDGSRAFGASGADLRAAASTVLIVGSGERSLAWLVGPVGAIAQIPAEAIHPFEETPEETLDHGLNEPAAARDDETPPPALKRYVTGLYIAPPTIETPGDARRFALLDVERALDDLLDALTEREGGEDEDGRA